MEGIRSDNWIGIEQWKRIVWGTSFSSSAAVIFVQVADLQSLKDLRLNLFQELNCSDIILLFFSA